MSEPIRTSQTHPLRIDFVACHKGNGEIGMTLCPGKQQDRGLTGRWRRDLQLDIERIADSGITTVVSLIEWDEFASLGVESLGDTVTAAGMSWIHLPIRDRSIPDVEFEAAWREQGAVLQRRLADGERILLHCMGGLGRTGSIAGRLLIEQGEDPLLAIGRVRQARPGTIETDEQEDYLRRCRWR